MIDPSSTGVQEVLQDLGRCIQALGPYADVAVLAGGLAPVLYRSIFLDNPSPRPAMTTFDMDWALPRNMPFRREGLQKLLEAGGFVCLLSGSAHRPVTRYQHVRYGKDKLGPIYVEFLTPRPGGQRDRHGQNQSIAEVEPGLHAQTDSYVGLLLFEPVEFDVLREPALRLGTSRIIRVAHPMSFIVQKCLIRRKRPLHKQENDATHIYDVAMLSYSRWNDMTAHLERIEQAGGFPPRWFRRVRLVLQGLFATPESAGVVEVTRKYQAMMAKSDAPSEDAICRAMTRFRNETGLK